MQKKYIFIGSFLAAAIIAAIVLLAVFVSNNSDVLVQTSSGSVRGVLIVNEIEDFYAFFRIPYAKPPINDLRFRNPEPIEPWEGVLDGTKPGPACAQISRSVDSSEDCLTLSIYTKDPDSRGKPVYVYIHGGALVGGSNSIENLGPHYFMQHDIVVVALQFRLDILGFLNLKMEEAPGNMALADCIEALRWLQVNIHNFGGNPDQITIGGFSSGGIMTDALLISPFAQGLFHQVIMQSGTSLSYRFVSNNTEPAIAKTKEEANMPNATNSELLQHLKTLTAAELFDIVSAIQNRYPTGYATYYPYTISRDYFGLLPRATLDLVQDNNYRHLPMMIGLTADEGIRMESLRDRLSYVNDNFYMVVPFDLYDIDDMSSEKNDTARIIKEFYFGDEDLTEETLPKYFDLCTDSWYGHIADYLIRLRASLNYSAPIYYYVFAVDGAYNAQKINAGTTAPGATHGDCEGYLWKKLSLDGVVPDDDYSDLSKERMVSMWSNFIKNGDPTPETNGIIPQRWEPVNYPTVNYFLINQTLSLEQEPFRERLLFWQRLYGYSEL